MATHRAAFGTRHGKLDAVSGPLRDVDIDAFLVDVDTDRFGTFTGTVARENGSLETAIAKAVESARVGSTALGISSEGSFGPDPVLGFVAVGLELVVLVDEARRHPVVGRDATHATNFAASIVHDLTQAEAFAARIGAPEHGLIAQVGGRPIEVLEPAAQLPALLAEHPALRLESDMRAYRNPTRMAAIGRAAQDLADMLRVSCRDCGAAGASNVQARPGLPCEACGAPTGRVLVVEACCSWCDAPMRLAPRHRLESADPGECPNCNP